MKRFNLFEEAKAVNADSKFVSVNGASYFIRGLASEFNPRSDDSLLQTLYYEYNPTLVNENEDNIDILSDASNEFRSQLFARFKEHWLEGNKFAESDPSYGVQEFNSGNGVYVLMSVRAGVAITFGDSDCGFYVTYMETLC